MQRPAGVPAIALSLKDIGVSAQARLLWHLTRVFPRDCAKVRACDLQLNVCELRLILRLCRPWGHTATRLAQPRAVTAALRMSMLFVAAMARSHDMQLVIVR